jgi:rhodanese-related sulfurtransferase
MEADVLKAGLENGDDLVVVDVRGPDEYNGPLGHIPDSRNIPLDELAVRIEELKPLRESTIILVCKTDKRSAKGALLLQKNGFNNVAIARGGMERWAEALE